MELLYIFFTFASSASLKPFYAFLRDFSHIVCVVICLLLHLGFLSHTRYSFVSILHCVL